MRALEEKYILLSVCLVALLGVPAVAEIQSVTFKTSRNTKFFWGSAISNLLRSQDGVEEVEDPYNNLRQGLVKIRARKDKAIDLARLVQLLENEVGFQPVTDVKLELRGRLIQRNTNLLFQTDGTQQTFAVERIEGEATAPPESKLLLVVATLMDPRSADRIVVQEWKAAEGEAGSASPKYARATPVATAELVISGMTWAGCASAVRAALLKVEGVLGAEVDFQSGTAHVTYNPAKVKPEQLPAALTGTPYTASLKTPRRR